MNLLLDELESCLPSGITVEKKLEDKEISIAISTFLRQQKKESRVIFIRRYWHCETIQTIAEHLGFSEGKVKSSLFRTRNLLKLYLEKEGIEI